MVTVTRILSVLAKVANNALVFAGRELPPAEKPTVTEMRARFECEPDIMTSTPGDITAG